MRAGRILCWLSLCALPLVACGGCRSAIDGAPVDVAGTAASQDSGGEGDPPVSESPGATCDRAFAFDDGSIETGYGFVPSSTWGMYLQRFDVPELYGKKVDQVCVCWMKTRDDADANFEVLFWGEQDRKLESEPYAVVEASTADLPTSKEDAGRFDPVEISDVTLPEGPSWIGVRWNPGEERYLFLCADHGSDVEDDVSIPVVYQEDRARGWADVQTARDPIFHGHRAAGIRVLVSDAP